MAAGIAAALDGLAGSEEGRVSLEVGAGGDRTAVIDRVAEDVVIAHCEALAAAGARFLLRSEELGDRSYGADHPVLLVDPVDGSLNAMQGIPYYCTSLCLVGGDTVEDAEVGVVRGLAVPRVYAAVREAGATLDGAPIRPLGVGLDGRRAGPHAPPRGDELGAPGGRAHAAARRDPPAAAARLRCAQPLPGGHGSRLGGDRAPGDAPLGLRRRPASCCENPRP